jgi:hypothetical protein
VRHKADLSCLPDEPWKYAAFRAMQGPQDAVDREYGESCFSVVLSTRPIRTTALAQTTTLRFTRDVAVRHKPENGEHQGGQDMMTTAQLLTDPEGTAIRIRDEEPIEDAVLADAEEEEIAELWAGDPGNQGA